MNRQPTTKDELTVVTMLSQCKTFSQVERALPHLNNHQIATIRDANGGNRIASLRFAAARLQRILDEETKNPPAPVRRPEPAPDPVDDDLDDEPEDQPGAPAPAPQPARRPTPLPTPAPVPGTVAEATISVDELLGHAITALQAARRALATPTPADKPRASRTPGPTPGTPASHSAEQAAFLDRYQTTIREVRDWARDEQIPCPAMGRFLPRAVITAYSNAHQAADA